MYRKQDYLRFIFAGFQKKWVKFREQHKRFRFWKYVGILIKWTVFKQYLQYTIILIISLHVNLNQLKYVILEEILKEPSTRTLLLVPEEHLER